jgi:hypothetical protein
MTYLVVHLKNKIKYKIQKIKMQQALMTLLHFYKEHNRKNKITQKKKK